MLLYVLQKVNYDLTECCCWLNLIGKIPPYKSNLQLSTLESDTVVRYRLRLRKFILPFLIKYLCTTIVTQCLITHILWSRGCPHLSQPKALVTNLRSCDACVCKWLLSDCLQRRRKVTVCNRPLKFIEWKLGSLTCFLTPVAWGSQVLATERGRLALGVRGTYFVTRGLQVFRLCPRL